MVEARTPTTAGGVIRCCRSASSHTSHPSGWAASQASGFRLTVVQCVWPSALSPGYLTAVVALFYWPRERLRRLLSRALEARVRNCAREPRNSAIDRKRLEVIYRPRRKTVLSSLANLARANGNLCAITFPFSSWERFAALRRPRFHYSSAAPHRRCR